MQNYENIFDDKKNTIYRWYEITNGWRGEREKKIKLNGCEMREYEYARIGEI